MLCLGVWIAEMVQYDLIFHSVYIGCSCLLMTELGQLSVACRAQFPIT